MPRITKNDLIREVIALLAISLPRLNLSVNHGLQIDGYDNRDWHTTSYYMTVRCASWPNTSINLKLHRDRGLRRWVAISGEVIHPNLYFPVSFDVIDPESMSQGIELRNRPEFRDDEKRIVSVAFITYNPYDRLFPPDDQWLIPRPKLGWTSHQIGGTERRALVVAPTKEINPHSDDVEIEKLLSAFTEALPSLSHVYIYLGAMGDHLNIKKGFAHMALEKTAAIPKEQVTLLACVCGFNGVVRYCRENIETWRSTRLIQCDCHGEGALEVLFENFLATGSTDSKKLITIKV